MLLMLKSLIITKEKDQAVNSKEYGSQAYVLLPRKRSGGGAGKDGPFDLASLRRGRDSKIVGNLQVQPEFWRGVEVPSQTKRCVCRNAAPPVDDFGHASGGYAKLQGKLVDAHSQGLQKVLSYRFAGMRERTPI